jgi:hypothetical protein
MTTTGRTWMFEPFSTFDASLVCGLLCTPRVGARRHPVPQDSLHLACEVLTGSFGAVPPPRR